KIGEQVGRHPDTCRHWPEHFPATWHRLFRAAEARHIATGGSEALAVLRIMLRNGSERARITAAQTLYRGRLAARVHSHEPDPSAEERLATEMSHLAAKETRACLLEKPIRALKKAGRKGPAGTPTEQSSEKLGDKVAKNGDGPAENGSTPAP